MVSIDLALLVSYQFYYPEVEGTAHITGRHEFLIDQDDPLRDGFILR